MKSPVLRVLVLLAAIAVGAPFGARWLFWHWEQNPILRGRRLAEKSGCLSCHHPFGGVEIPNPRSRWSSVPSLQGGNAAMYATSRTDIEEFIRNGAPDKWTSDADTRSRLAAQHIRMPAWGVRFSNDQIADLAAFACAEGDLDLAGGEPAERGRETARNNGCLSCHGVEGSGGLPNPGSIGGFIPGFAGKNFSDLVKNEAEFREWVKTGTCRRLEDNPVASHFWKRQQIAMPAFGEMLDDEDIGHLWVWVQAVRAGPAKKRS